MDANLAFWTGALANMALAAGLAVHGVRCARRAEYARHARAMRAAALLVALFLLSYVLKVALLGREPLELWSGRARGLLHFHELCVLAMLAGGSAALWLGGRLRRTRLVSGAPADPGAPLGLRRRHRIAGRAAVAGAILGAASAAGVLGGMYARSGWLDVPALARAEPGEARR